MGTKRTCTFLIAVFFGTLLRAEETGTHINKLQLVPQISILSPGEMVLKNEAYEIPYSQSVPGMFGFSIGSASPLHIEDAFQLYFVSRLGFAYKQANYSITESNTRNTTNSTINLSWVPASIGVKSVFAVNKFPFVRPTLSVGSGASWLYQSSATDGLSQNFLVPFFYITPGLAFFEKQTPDDWFGGFSFGVTYQDSFASPQRVRATSFDLSINIIP